MLRGTLVLFAGMFTISILRRRLYIHNWLGMVLITAGAALVGASSVLHQESAGHNNTSLIPAGSSLGLYVQNTTAAAGLHLHYSAGYSRVASRGLLGPQGGLLNHTNSRVLGGESSDVAAAPLFGDILVVIAQMFTALQFITEEKYLVQFKVGSNAMRLTLLAVALMLIFRQW